MGTSKKSMKACVLHNINDLRYEDVPMPEPASGQVLIKIKASGICGSDIQRVFKKGTYHFPTIPGHEFAGEIVDVASDVDSSLIGKKAAVFPLIPCRSCPSCQIGEYAQCSNYDYYGSRRDGGFAEYLAVDQFNLVIVPQEVSYEEAAMCEPTAVAIHALSQADICFGDTIAIFGAGTIGLILAKIARASGASKVILIDIDDRKLEFAKKLGFEHVVNNANGDAISEINKITGNKGSVVTLEGTGVPDVLEQCLKSTAAFGRVVLMGNPLRDMKISQKAYWEILRRQLTLKGTWNSSYNGFVNNWECAVNAMPKLGLKDLITHRYDLSQCNEAFDAMRSHKDLVLKAMFVLK